MDCLKSNRPPCRKEYSETCRFEYQLQFWTGSDWEVDNSFYFRKRNDASKRLPKLKEGQRLELLIKDENIELLDIVHVK